MLGPRTFFTRNEQLEKSGEKINLIFSIINPTNARYSMQAKLYDNKVIDYNSETKTAQNNILIFENFLLCDFFFEKEQKLFIILKKNNQKININTTLGQIVGLNQCTYTYKIAPNESFLIKAQKIGKNDNLVKFNFILKEHKSINNFFAYNKYYFIITSNNRKLYLSEENDNNGAFLPTNIPTLLLQPFYTVNFYNLQNQLIATINKTLQEISLQNNKSQKDIKPKAIQMNNDALYIYDYSTITKDYSFIDYIKAGVIIALSIGIDFTGSNGHPLDDGTLHSIKNGPNDYEKAITSCGYIVAYYDYDQLFPVYGFGAKIRDSLNDEVSMCFNLNFTNNPDIYTIGNIIKTYHEVIEQDKLDFSGPTHFTPLIKEVISRIDKNNIFEYHILMILTDGVIDDLQDTIDILVEASTLPLSVIIIGIGNEDFTKMEILDGDEVPLKARNGKIRERDLVQFVPFSKFKNDEKILSMEVLAEIPRQMIEYYQFKNLDPDTIRQLIQKNKKINVQGNNNNNYGGFNNNNGGGNNNFGGGNNNNFKNYNNFQNTGNSPNQNYIPQNSFPNYNSNNNNNNNNINKHNNFNQQGNNNYPMFYDNIRQNQNNNVNKGNMTHRNYQSKISNQNVPSYQNNNNNYKGNNLNTSRSNYNKNVVINNNNSNMINLNIYNNNMAYNNSSINNLHNNNMKNNNINNNKGNQLCNNSEYLSNNNFNCNNNLMNNNNMNNNNMNNNNMNNNNMNNSRINNNNNNNINNNNNSNLPYSFFQNNVDLDNLPENKTIYISKK
jgi:hypothetical protein